jgi:hypothetical protein
VETASLEGNTLQRTVGFVVPAAIDFQSNQARRKLLKECQHVSTLQLTAEDYLAFRIDTVNLKNRLRDIEADCRNRLHNLAPPNRGRLNSTPIHGAHAPVEEPSTASKPDIGRTKTDGPPDYGFRYRFC